MSLPTIGLMSWLASPGTYDRTTVSRSAELRELRERAAEGDAGQWRS